MENTNGVKRLYTIVAGVLILLGGGTGTVSLIGQQREAVTLDTVRNNTEDTLKNVQREMDKRDARIQALAEAVDSNAGSIASMKTDIQNTKEDVAEIKGDVKNIQHTLSDITVLLRQALNKHAPQGDSARGSRNP